MADPEEASPRQTLTEAFAQRPDHDRAGTRPPQKPPPEFRGRSQRHAGRVCGAPRRAQRHSLGVGLRSAMASQMRSRRPGRLCTPCTCVPLPQSALYALVLWIERCPAGIENRYIRYIKTHFRPRFPAPTACVPDCGRGAFCVPGGSLVSGWGGLHQLPHVAAGLTLGGSHDFQPREVSSLDATQMIAESLRLRSSILCLGLPDQFEHGLL